MNIELIISFISLGATFIVGILTLFANIKISKIENLESKRKYDKEITYFELQFKDEQWLYDILKNGEFDLYSIKSKKKIFNWWTEYQKDHPPVLLIPQVAYERMVSQRGSGWCGSTGIVAGRVNQVGAGEVKSYDDLQDPEDLF